MTDTFAGFPSPTKNFFSMPNEIINIIAHITNMSELKILIYIIRHTWGFHEYGVCKPISTDEFMNGRRKQGGTRMDEGTGLSNRSVIDGLRAAEKHGYLISVTDDSDKARTVKSYMLRMDESDVKILHTGTCEDTSYVPMKKVHKGCEEGSQQAEPSSHRSEKDTKRKTLEKDIETQESTDASALASAARTPFSSQAEQIRIATSEQEASEKVGQDGHTDLARHPGNHQHRAESHRNRSENLGLGTQQQEVADENNSHSHSDVTQANNVAPAIGERADELPPIVRPPRPQPTPPVLKAVVPEKQSNLLDCPLSEPRMTGPWDDEKCVQYAEWYKKRRYTDKMRPGQLQAAHLLNKEDSQLTLEQFKLAFDDWRPWWTENRGPLNVSDLRVKQKNGVQRYQTALDRLEMQGNKARQQPAATGDKPRASVLVSEEQARKNMDKMRASVAAKQAAMAAAWK